MTVEYGHLRAALQMSRMDEQRSAKQGIIYVACHIAASDSSSAQQHSFLRSNWRSFAETAVLAEMGVSAHLTGRHWMNDDLFLVVDLPAGSQEMLEDWLLELAGKQQVKWESSFQQWKGSQAAILHAGIAIIEHGVSWDDALYNAAKQAILHGQTAGAIKHSMRLRALRQLIDKQQIHPVYQPIMALQGDSHTIFGYEALTRCRDNEWFDGPMQLFDFAEQEGMAYSLDRLAREKAIDGSASLQKQQKLFINVTAQIMNDPRFTPGKTLSLLERQHLSPHNVVFEITERSYIHDFGAVKKVLEHYRKQGYQIAIDDVGAGYSSLQAIVELRPDYIKVDRSIIQHIDQDEVKEHILSTLVQLAHKIGIALIAEGIENEAELLRVKEMGVQLGQGYLLGRPGELGSSGRS